MSSDIDKENGKTGKSSSSKIPLLILLLIVCAGGYLYFFTCLIQPCVENTPPLIKHPLPKPNMVQDQTSSNEKSGQQGEDKNLPNQPGVKGVNLTQNGNNVQNAPNGSSQLKAIPAESRLGQNKNLSDQPGVKGATLLQNGNNTQNSSNRPSQSKVAPVGSKPGQVGNQPVPKQFPLPAGTTSQKVATGVSGNQPVKPGSKVSDSVPVNDRNIKSGKSGNLKASEEVTENGNNTATPHKKVRKGIYTLHIGDFVTPTTVNADRRKIQKAGLKLKIVKSAAKRNEPMTRLFVSSFDSKENATTELNQLKEVTNDGFIILHNGIYSVYAGSYYSPSTVSRAEKRLNNAGYAVTRQNVNVPLPIYKLSAGRFDSCEAAQAGARKLRRAGIKAKIVKLR